MTNTPLVVNELIGQRVLLKEGYGGFEEFKVIEVSPSGIYCRLQTVYSRKIWKSIAGLSLVDVLKPIEAHPEARVAIAANKRMTAALEAIMLNAPQDTFSHRAAKEALGR